jgi:hypothetical protein
MSRPISETSSFGLAERTKLVHHVSIHVEIMLVMSITVPSVATANQHVTRAARRVQVGEI